MTSGTERTEAGFVQAALAGSRFEMVRWVEETGSTNDDLAELAREGAPEQVLITDLQTAGRGRRNRVWDAPARTSILMSVLIRDADPRDGFWSVGAVALGASQAIDAITVSPCRLKWPNDVLLSDLEDETAEKKVAGVLAQVVDDAVIVGIGINVNWPEMVPDELTARGTAVNRHVHPAPAVDPPDIDRGPLAADILRRAIGHLDSDPETLRAAWRRQCTTLGRQVRLEQESGTIVAEAVDISPEGALILDQDGVRSAHHVGDVVHARPL